MSLISAEMSKVCLNAFITMKISFANTIANLCEKIPGTDPDDITQAIGTDQRISPYYFKAGLACGGSCFPRDMKVFETLLKKYNLFSGLMTTIKDINAFQDYRLAEVVLREYFRYPLEWPCDRVTVGILGLSFIPNSPVIIESPGIKLLSRLLEKQISVTVYDPYALSNVRVQFDNSVMYATSIEECISKSQIIVVAHRSEDFKKAIESYRSSNAITVIDCWRIIDPTKIKGTVDYIPFGKYNA
jgi:UDPglucose 6-dehydrogenase